MPQADLIPQSFWFRLALDCPRADGIPAAGGRSFGLPAKHALPAFQALDGRESWAEVRAGWNPKGLGLAFEVTGKTRPVQSDAYAIGGRDEVEIWIDTRDTRDVHRATRFCHHFLVTFQVSGKSLKAEVAALKIHRAQADAPFPKAGLVSAWAEATPVGYRLELFFPAEALNGFDAETNRRLGFCYRIGDPERGDSFLALGREFPIGEDPSLWATLALQD
ncbi:MAG: hypothetical protein U0800_19685 [Isosphaeraceae bacterium]